MRSEPGGVLGVNPFGKSLLPIKTQTSPKSEEETFLVIEMPQDNKREIPGTYPSRVEVASILQHHILAILDHVSAILQHVQLHQLMGEKPINEFPSLLSSSRPLSTLSLLFFLLFSSLLRLGSTPFCLSQLLG